MRYMDLKAEVAAQLQWQVAYGLFYWVLHICVALHISRCIIMMLCSTSSIHLCLRPFWYAIHKCKEPMHTSSSETECYNGAYDSFCLSPTGADWRLILEIPPCDTCGDYVHSYMDCSWVTSIHQTMGIVSNLCWDMHDTSFTWEYVNSWKFTLHCIWWTPILAW